MIALLLVLSACGFHLRGAVDLETNLKELAIQDPGTTAIAADLRRTLISLDVEVHDAANQVLVLHSENNSKRVLSVDEQGRAQIYDLLYEVSFSLLDADGIAWISKETISVHRDLQFDPNAVLGSSSEEQWLREEMRRDAIGRILRRLQNAAPPEAAS